MSLKIILLLICTCSLLQSYSQAKQFKIGEERRRYIVYLPAEYSKAKDRQFPVVFNFHGGGMTMAEQMFYSGMNKVADKSNFIVVYPQGLNQDWNVGFEMSYTKGTNDVEFIEKLLSFLITQYRVDTSAIYATGLSRGGFFCHRLAAELPEKFAAIASIGGLLPDSVAHFHSKQTPVSVMIIHGTADDIVKYDGKKNAYKSATETYEYWRKHNHLVEAKENISTINRIRNDSTEVEIRETLVSAVGVTLVSITGGGHTIPGADSFNIGFPLGSTTNEIDANEVIWNFFSTRKKRKD